jgi:L-threonylcarbamoyladenylate synthase
LSRVLVCDTDKPDLSVIETAVAALNDGSVVVMPTETQYSLSVRADDENAMTKICAVKRRSETVKAALFIRDIQAARPFCRINRAAEKLAARFLPGPLTLVLPGISGQETVAPEFLSEAGFGIRISSSPVISAVMERVSFAVTATSANLSGQNAAMNIADIRRSLGDAVDLYIDAGPCRSSTPSTVVQVDDRITILRPGAIAEAEILRTLEEEE